MFNHELKLREKTKKYLKTAFFSAFSQPFPVLLFAAGGQPAILLLPPTALECEQHLKYHSN